MRHSTARTGPTGHARPMPVPPWMAMVQAHADRAEAALAAGAKHVVVDMPRRAGTEQLARDIANAAVSSCPDDNPTCPACTPEEPQP
ncbi:hypothetical protein [Brachybacterium massiliense]|uniref:hypothetical protein n=1 Tax=Brachybacterium massiliense TaxID=1755098 RepID=UPI000B3BCBDD|nr:hypothetical protein [Brachybacterium massiliense]